MGFSLEIDAMKDDLISLNAGFLNATSENEVFIQETPFYSDNRMYFLFRKDLFLLDDKTSRDLFLFYTNLLVAEQNRNLVFEIRRISDVRELTVPEKYRQQMLTKNIKQAIHNSVKVLPDLEKELMKNHR